MPLWHVFSHVLPEQHEGMAGVAASALVVYSMTVSIRHSILSFMFVHS